MPVAGRVVFQPDQAASSDQSLFRDLGERSQDPNLDRDLGRRDRRHRQKAPQPVSLYETLQILSLTMFERMSLDQLLDNIMTDYFQTTSDNQLNLFD